MGWRWETEFRSNRQIDHSFKCGVVSLSLHLMSHVLCTTELFLIASGTGNRPWETVLESESELSRGKQEGYDVKMFPMAYTSLSPLDSGWEQSDWSAVEKSDGKIFTKRKERNRRWFSGDPLLPSLVYVFCRTNDSESSLFPVCILGKYACSFFFPSSFDDHRLVRAYGVKNGKERKRQMSSPALSDCAMDSMKRNFTGWCCDIPGLPFPSLYSHWLTLSGLTMQQERHKINDPLLIPDCCCRFLCCQPRTDSYREGRRNNGTGHDSQSLTRSLRPHQLAEWEGVAMHAVVTGCWRTFRVPFFFSYTFASLPHSIVRLLNMHTRGCDLWGPTDGIHCVSLYNAQSGEERFRGRSLLSLTHTHRHRNNISWRFISHERQIILIVMYTEDLSFPFNGMWEMCRKKKRKHKGKRKRREFDGRSLLMRSTSVV